MLPNTNPPPPANIMILSLIVNIREIWSFGGVQDVVPCRLQSVIQAFRPLILS